MADTKDISTLIQQTVSEVFDAQSDRLKQEISRKVTEALGPVLEELADSAKPPKSEEVAAGGAPTDLLYAAVGSIYDAAGQADILKAMLDGAAEFTARAALFVVKAGNLSLWQARGFANDLKGVNLSGASGLAGRALQDKEPVSAAAAEFDSNFISAQGNPFDGNATVHPLVVRDKVAAVLYTDGGTDMPGHSDQSAVRVLVRSASSWLEILALRKSGGAAEAAAPEPIAQAAAAPMPVAAPVAAPEPPPPPPPPVVAAPPAAAPAPAAADPGAGLSPEDQELHKKAKRFAKLLVDEIKLYNQAKVTEGRQNKNLYSLLKEDIDKSRNTYDKRYGSTVAASAGYFTAEVIRILADNDESALGDGFK
ncbi:MAG TPA: GAF domain-containing protein [Terriglobales bacterium]|nr:GAF domain-containing protein [Terriglobales bacterium]